MSKGRTDIENIYYIYIYMYIYVSKGGQTVPKSRQNHRQTDTRLAYPLIGTIVL